MDPRAAHGERPTRSRRSRTSTSAHWKVGQYTGFSGIEGRQEGNAHFCGEHTSIDFQWYLNGAVETGERAAGQVIDDLG